MRDEYAHHVLAAMVDAVVVLDPEGKIFAINDATTRLLGYTHSELSGRDVACLFADEAAAIHSTTRHRLVEAGSDLRREEVDFREKCGAVIPVSVTGSPIIDERGVLSGIVLVARDLRETRRLLAKALAAEQELRDAKLAVEEELDRTRRQLLQAERLATLGTLAGGVGHELVNIATVLSGNLEQLVPLTEGDDAVQSKLRALELASEHVTQHARRLLSLARPGAAYEEPLDLREVVESTLDMLRGAGKTKYVRVSADLPSIPVMVTVNRTRIEQILVNLLGNAADALADTDPRQRRVRVVVECVDERGRVRCQVTDNGPGIPPEILDAIFEPFYSTKPADEGTGLGLSVVKQIVEAYGGHIAVTSTLGNGATFVFDLPSA